MTGKNPNLDFVNIDAYLHFQSKPMKFCLFVFVALRPMSTVMVIAGRSVHFTTLFPGQA